jgi:hypothetical protein
MEHEITNQILDDITPQFVQIAKRFWFRYDLMQAAKHDLEIRPHGIRVFWDDILNHRHVNDPKELYKKAIEHCDFYVSDNDLSYSDHEIAEARYFMQCSGCLREVCLAIGLRMCDKEGKIYKNIEQDLGYGGIDLSYVRSWDGKVFHFAVKHEGKVSRRHHNTRKIHKKAKGVIELWATHPFNNRSVGLHVVPRLEIMKYTCGEAMLNVEG